MRPTSFTPPNPWRIPGLLRSTALSAAWWPWWMTRRRSAKQKDGNTDVKPCRAGEGNHGWQIWRHAFCSVFVLHMFSYFCFIVIQLLLLINVIPLRCPKVSKMDGRVLFGSLHFTFLTLDSKHVELVKMKLWKNWFHGEFSDISASPQVPPVTSLLLRLDGNDARDMRHCGTFDQRYPLMMATFYNISSQFFGQNM